ncbi:hypothetical protein WN55_01201 [Dufourea novaeangliae]|uniref:Uncharacterized protein n=1 Tax=Dufourea novaeangliae TaxID=178035 RepID=A0A154PCJ9_DUFNO|nr:hypothetical protein WN55_01201 [Dufourea novaeangliae]
MWMNLCLFHQREPLGKIFVDEPEAISSQGVTRIVSMSPVTLRIRYTSGDKRVPLWVRFRLGI